MNCSQSSHMSVSGRNSPSSEVMSGSPSPHVLRPLVTPQISQKQRLLSMNLVSSMQSASFQRSMSIISLGLPRNSIVSIDDNFLRPTRNNSTSSLVSLGQVSGSNVTTNSNTNFPATGPAPDSIKDFVLVNRLQKMRQKNSSAILLDEDSETEIAASRFRWRRRSSDKIQKPPPLSALKKDFKFKYDHYLKLKSQPPPVPPPTRLLDDSTPSPHSPADIQLPTQALAPISVPTSPASTSLDDSSRSSVKKLRNSSITQLMFLKKRLLMSKDFQLELHPHAVPMLGADTNFPGPPPHHHVHFQHPMPREASRAHSHPIHSHAHFLNSHLNLHLVNSHHSPLPNPHSQGHSPSLSPQPLHTMPSVHPSDLLPSSGFSPPLQSPPLENEGTTIRRQNILISQLNRKWNKATQGEAKTDRDVSAHLNRKRCRSDLASSTDSLAS